MTGELEIGLYPLLDGDRCTWLAADFDGAAAMLDARACPAQLGKRPLFVPMTPWVPPRPCGIAAVIARGTMTLDVG